jgi:hypothetical protein
MKEVDLRRKSSKSQPCNRRQTAWQANGNADSSSLNRLLRGGRARPSCILSFHLSKTFMARNRYLARSIRARLRETPWNAATIAWRAGVSRTVMAKILHGDDDVGFGVFCDVAFELRLSVEFRPLMEPRRKPGAIPTVVDLALLRLHAK